MAGLTVPVNDSPDPAFTPLLSALLNGGMQAAGVTLTPDILSPYAKAFATVGGQSIYGIAQTGQVEAGQ